MVFIVYTQHLSDMRYIANHQIKLQVQCLHDNRAVLQK